MRIIARSPRVRLTHALYLVLLVLVATSDGRFIQRGWALPAQSPGFLLVTAGVLGRMWTTVFITGRKDVQLVRDGPYSVSRHPLYLCSIVAAIGIGLTTLSLSRTVLLPLLVGIIVIIAARREDAVLLAAYGAAFREYRDRVPVFWPACSQWQPSPATVLVQPGIYRRAFQDAAAFLCLWLLILVLESLHAGGAWPTLFQLP